MKLVTNSCTLAAVQPTEVGTATALSAVDTLACVGVSLAVQALTTVATAQKHNRKRIGKENPSLGLDVPNVTRQMAARKTPPDQVGLVTGPLPRQGDR